METAQKALFPIVTICIFLFLLTSSVRLLTTNFYLQYQYQKFNIAQKAGLTRQELNNLSRGLVKFLTSSEKFPSLANSLFEPREISHLYDVQKLFRAVFIVQKITGIYLLLCLSLALFPPRRKNLNRFFFYIFLGCLTSIFIILFLALAIFFYFPSFFTGFHELFFKSGSWLFGPNDMLIRLYPEEFWLDSAKTLVFLTLAGAIVLSIFSGFISYRRQDKYQITSTK